MPTLKNLEKKALSLTEKERITLTLKLFESLEPEPDTEGTMSEWIEEAHARYQAWKRGEVKTISEEEAVARIQRRLKKN